MAQAQKKQEAPQPEPNRLMRPRESASGQFPILAEGGGESVQTVDEMGRKIKQAVEVTFDNLGREQRRLLWEPWVIKPSELYPADHPIVQGWPHLFAPAGPTAPGYATLEVVE